MWTRALWSLRVALILSLVGGMADEGAHCGNWGSSVPRNSYWIGSFSTASGPCFETSCIWCRRQNKNLEVRQSHKRVISKTFHCLSKGHRLHWMGLSLCFSVLSGEPDLLASFPHVLESACCAASIETPSSCFLPLVITLCREIGPSPREHPVFCSHHQSWMPKSRQRISPHTNLLSGLPLICMKSMYLFLFVLRVCEWVCVRVLCLSSR